jgi:hypothetical protein
MPEVSTEVLPNLIVVNVVHSIHSIVSMSHGTEDQVDVIKPLRVDEEMAVRKQFVVLVL